MQLSRRTRGATVELPLETVEEIYATPLDSVSQVQKLIAAASRVIVLPSADRSAATLKEGAEKT